MPFLGNKGMASYLLERGGKKVSDIKRTMVFKGSGYAIIQDPTSGLYKTELARLGDMTLEMGFESTDVFGGDSLYAFDVVDNDRTQSITFTNNEFDLGILNALGGAFVQRGVAVEVPIINEGHRIPMGSPYTISLAKATATVNGSEIVKDAETGEHYKKVTTTPGSMEYSIAGGVITFSATDANAEVIVNYRYLEPTGDTAVLMKGDRLPAVEIWHKHEFIHAGGQRMAFVTHVFRAKGAGTLSVALSRNTAATHALNFKVLDPGRADEKIIQFSVVNAI